MKLTLTMTIIVTLTMKLAIAVINYYPHDLGPNPGADHDVNRNLDHETVVDHDYD